jgi:hypothetical protein
MLTANGLEYAFDLAGVSPRLASAGKKERESFVISPSGYGIRWPLLDEDLSLDALIASSAPDGASAGRH